MNRYCWKCKRTCGHIEVSEPKYFTLNGKHYICKNLYCAACGNMTTQSVESVEPVADSNFTRDAFRRLCAQLTLLIPKIRQGTKYKSKNIP